jgi:hypothetical protein
MHSSCVADSVRALLSGADRNFPARNRRWPPHSQALFEPETGASRMPRRKRSGMQRTTCIETQEIRIGGGLRRFGIVRSTRLKRHPTRRCTANWLKSPFLSVDRHPEPSAGLVGEARAPSGAVLLACPPTTSGNRQTPQRVLRFFQIFVLGRPTVD